MIRRPPRSTLSSSSAASDVYKRQGINAEYGGQADNRMESRMELVLRNCHLATMCDGGYTIVTDAALGVRDGRIGWVGKECDLPGSMLEEAEVRDLRGAWVTPGLIDCHSHVVYGGDRAGEWELKLKGASYKEVAEAGGGIVNTVDGTRKATVEQLVRSAAPRIEALLAEGVTTMEIKSGYGLELAAERKQLQAARRIGEEWPLTVKATFLGAHAVPREFAGRSDEYIDEVVQMMDVLDGEKLVDAVDVFCETIGFTPAQTRKVFDQAKSLMLPVRLHGDQLTDCGCGELAAEYGALTLDHCEYTSEQGAYAMAASRTVAVLLPSANYFIKEIKRPPVQYFREAGVRMALATNCNPGSSPCCSLLVQLNMGCTLFGMLPEEALLGVTQHAADALGMGETHGSIQVGKVADLAVWDITHPSELSYYLGLNRLQTCFYHGKERCRGRLLSK
eukprot:TRINITY_DN11339_c0_g2_i1.p1 TRINITY_DN11339_c0_g2~~TRINITY_DN11339_c0_g2_i1.p1  ORF type:complete len:449 (+),score=126.18 TRINITY_DN11339_c0_g2_i1:126-1472(+)